MSAKQVLLDELKAEGLDIAEDAAIGVAKAVFRAMPKFFAATENKYDDFLIAVLPVVEPHVIQLLDKIDNEDDIPG